MTTQDHVWRILDDVLLLLAGQYYPTPERTYKLDGGWSLALADLKRCFADLRAKLALTEAERDAARKRVQDCETRMMRYAIELAEMQDERDAARAEVERLKEHEDRARWCEEARAVELDSKTGIAPEVLEGLLPDSAWLAQREREAAAKAEAVAVKLLGQLADEHATGREPRQSYTTGYQDALFHTHDKIRERIAAAIDAARGVK